MSLSVSTAAQLSTGVATGAGSPESAESLTARLAAQPGLGLLANDPWLASHAPALRERWAYWQAASAEVLDRADHAGPIDCGHQYFGFHRGTADNTATGQPGLWYREWAPAARQLSLIGEFNHWDRTAHAMARIEPAATGVWAVFVADLPDGQPAIPHASRVKVCITDCRGQTRDRIPAYIRYATQDPATRLYDGVHWAPPQPFTWTAPPPTAPARRAAQLGGLRIYESHVGMATEAHRVGTYEEFANTVLPRVAKLGYNAVQLMAVAEHPYYGSFGYHVSNLFAPSSRCGTPEQLKALVNAAHGLGLLVLMDIVHSHAIKNLNEGLAHFDGTPGYFREGLHPAWDSHLFDYRHREVLRLLLSNIRYWLDEFAFDGFRFDGVTSMMYRDHGLNRSFGGYADYFGPNTDPAAITYLQLANTVAHRIRPGVITIAEDVSGMPGLARPVSEGGVGFDYRLSMGLPDFWIKILKERRDEQWPMGDLWHCLTNRRSPQGEKHIAYAESHDQALVGDKTLAFRLMDAEMYWNMARDKSSIIIDRGLALHKMIRLVSFAFGGEGWLNFMGNEFGHPEWIDFPRDGNGYSHSYARRQWSLVDNPALRYGDLNAFDAAMQALDARHDILLCPLIEQLWCHEDDKLLIGRRGPLVIAFNWHPTNSRFGLRVPVPHRGDYQLVLDTDAPTFGGLGRNTPSGPTPWQDVPHGGHAQSIQIYLPARTAQVYIPCAGGGVAPTSSL